MKKKYWLLAVGIVAFDRITKYYALQLCTRTCQIASFLKFTLVYNRGVSWGLFHSHDALIFSLVNVTILGVAAALCYYAYQRAKAGHQIIGELVAIAGAASNIFDRYWYGGVVDFILFSYGSWYFPVFNIADVAIVAGVLLMVLVGIREQ